MLIANVIVFVLELMLLLMMVVVVVNRLTGRFIWPPTNIHD